MSKAEKSARRHIAQNRRARHDYEILEEVECGLVLTGTEVKSLRGGKATLDQAYAHFRGSELFLIGAHIAEYTQGNVHNHAPLRERKLLLHKRELLRWQDKVKERGFTLVPLSMYFEGSRAKLLLALARGKREYDKRQATREREDRREMDRATSRARRGQ